MAIELLSSPRPSSPVFEGEKYPVFCSSPLVIATVSKSTANLKSITKYDSLDKFSEESEDLALLEKNRCLNLQLKRGSSVKVDLSSDNDLATIPCSAPAKLNNISSTSDEFDMSFMRKRSIDPKKGAQSFRLNLPEPKLPTKVSKKTLKPLRKNNSEVNTERQTERQSKEDKQRHNNELAQEKQLEKQRKIEEKQRLLQEKEAVQAVKAANALRQKNTAADEIVVSMCNEWSQYPSSKPICESISQSGARVVISKHKLPFTLTFSRKVNRDFDFFNTQVWKPCSERIEVEPYTLLYFPAEKLSQLIKQKNGLVNNLNSAMKIYPGHTYIYLIEGLLEFYKRRKRLESKHENDLLKIAMGEKVVKRKEDIPKLLAEMPEPKAFENALTLLQNFGKGKCKIQFSPASETAGWVVSFLQQIAIFPEMQYFCI